MLKGWQNNEKYQGSTYTVLSAGKVLSCYAHSIKVLYFLLLVTCSSRRYMCTFILFDPHNDTTGDSGSLHTFI